MKTLRSKCGPAVVAVVFAALAFRLFRLTAQYAVNIFFWDQWDFNNASLFGHHTIWEIFRFQHGPHRQGLGGVLAALVEPWFRWNSRTEAFLVTGIVVIAGLCMLWLTYRLAGTMAWTQVAIPMMVFTPAQWESGWNTVNLAHGILPVFLIVLYCLAWTWRHERAKYAVIVLLNFVTLYTGFGFFLGLLTPVLLWGRYREARNQTGSYLLTCVALSLVSLASFFVAYTNDDASGCKSILAASPMDYARYICLMFASPWGFRSIGVVATMAGGATLAGVGAIAVVTWKSVLFQGVDASGPRLVVAILSAYSILFCAATTVGRTCLGMDGAHSSRYAIYKQLAVLGVFLWALTVRRRGWRVAWTYVLPVLLIPSLFVTPSDREGMTVFSKLKNDWRVCYLSGHSPDVCDEAGGAIYPDPERTHLQQKLDFLRTTRQNLFSDPLFSKHPVSKDPEMRR